MHVPLMCLSCPRLCVCICPYRVSRALHKLGHSTGTCTNSKTTWAHAQTRVQHGHTLKLGNSADTVTSSDTAWTHAQSHSARTHSQTTLAHAQTRTHHGHGHMHKLGNSNKLGHSTCTFNVHTDSMATAGHTQSQTHNYNTAISMHIVGHTRVYAQTDTTRAHNVRRDHNRNTFNAHAIYLHSRANAGHTAHHIGHNTGHTRKLGHSTGTAGPTYNVHPQTRSQQEHVQCTRNALAQHGNCRTHSTPIQCFIHNTGHTHANSDTARAHLMSTHEQRDPQTQTHGMVYVMPGHRHMTVGTLRAQPRQYRLADHDAMLSHHGNNDQHIPTIRRTQSRSSSVCSRDLFCPSSNRFAIKCVWFSQSKAPSMAASSGQWSCSTCTFENGANKLKCEMCQNPRSVCNLSKICCFAIAFRRSFLRL